MLKILIMVEQLYHGRLKLLILLVCIIIFSCNVEKTFIHNENFQKGNPQKFINYASSGLYEIIYLYPNYRYLYYKRDLLMQKAEGTWKFSNKRIEMAPGEIKSGLVGQQRIFDTVWVSLAPKELEVKKKGKLLESNGVVYRLSEE